MEMSAGDDIADEEIEVAEVREDEADTDDDDDGMGNEGEGDAGMAVGIKTLALAKYKKSFLDFVLQFYSTKFDLFSQQFIKIFIINFN